MNKHLFASGRAGLLITGALWHVRHDAITWKYLYGKTEDTVIIAIIQTDYKRAPRLGDGS